MAGLFDHFEKYDVQATRAEAKASGYVEGHAEGHAQGHAEGHAQGHAQGYADCQTEMIQNALKNGHSAEEIVAFMNVDIEVINKVKEEQ